MPDITMCNNKACPSSNICHRQTAKPSQYQSMSTYEFDKDTGSCEDFIPTRYCPKCNKNVETIKKFGGVICAECRLIIRSN
jgi:protein-arginine kinase activator protein McsA